MLKRKGQQVVCFGFSLFLLVFGVGWAGAEILFSDDFESGSFAEGWHEWMPSLKVTDDNPHRGTYSARAMYDVVERNNKIEVHRDWESFYLRYYLYFQQGFRFPAGLKLMRIGAWAASDRWWYTNFNWMLSGSDYATVYLQPRESSVELSLIHI